MAPQRKTRWVPNYHGAWAMIFIPPILGIIAGGFVWQHIILLALWWVGYFDFFAIGLWLRSRRKPRYLLPVLTYSSICAVLGLALAFLKPALLIWIPIFLPLIAVTFWQSAIRADRSMLNDTVTVIAASLLLPVAYQLGSLDGPTDSWNQVWLHTALVFGYFLGTVFYVKTNIRQRGHQNWLAASVGWHLVWCTLATIAAWFIDDVHLSPWHVAIWIMLTIRAYLVPWWGARHGWVSAKTLGIGEIAASAAVMATLLVS
ncbi:YwiC-like protein [Arcanobacterium phocae]|uniref:YwiC-like protein n=1 Tax=Arcanobacterium phocae TaxID=131112 RepID=A0A1H2LAW2_9ACTO|nr:YwiC-like family protein [Arcanobacterium phocae]SDU78059.1 YwiC-like protein [Arcanobacterium phocae]